MKYLLQDDEIKKITSLDSKQAILLVSEAVEKGLLAPWMGRMGSLEHTDVYLIWQGKDISAFILMANTPP